MFWFRIIVFVVLLPLNFIPIAGTLAFAYLNGLLYAWSLQVRKIILSIQKKKHLKKLETKQQRKLGSILWCSWLFLATTMGLHFSSKIGLLFVWIRRNVAWIDSSRKLFLWFEFFIIIIIIIIISIIFFQL